MRQAREHRKLKQDELAALVPGSSQAMISALEKRDSETTALLFEFADALRINPRWLQNGEPEESWLDEQPEAADPLVFQLIDIYTQLSPDTRDALLGNANRLLAKEKPGASVANPYGASATIPPTAKAKLRRTR